MAILTDALESTVNVVAGMIGLYSLYVSAKPRDIDHPYGHGKVEFISAAIEGTLITVAGLLILYEAISNLWHPHEITRIDYGIYLVATTAVLNYIAGYICVRTGKRNNSLALIASGKHLITDTVTTAGIIGGLILLWVTGITWIDSAVAILFAFIIFYTGYKIVRTSIAGIMDEADLDLLNKFIEVLNKNKVENWIDLHNLRVIKYGSLLHIDCHLTVPWFLNVHEAHREIDSLSDLIKSHFGDSIELFVHTDGCLAISCGICNKNCPERQATFEKKLTWNLENILSNKKHQLET